LKVWTTGLDKNDPKYEHHLLEALWVSWGLNKIDKPLLLQLLNANDFRARSAAVRVLRYGGHQIADQADLLMQAAKDDSARVRLEALVAASWLDKEIGEPIVLEAGKKELDHWMKPPYDAAIAHFNNTRIGEVVEKIDTKLIGSNRELFIKGKEIYERDGYCATCHQPDGNGLQASGFPPLTGSEWVTGSEERLIKLTMKGIMGPIEVKGKKYPGQVPMTPFGGMLNDDEMSAVLTYVRNMSGNQALPVSAATVKQIREEIKDKQGFYSAEELLKAHPMK